MENIVTTDLTKFGSRERKMVEDLLKAWRKQGLPEDFYEDEVAFMMNMDSGCVFLTNSNCDTAMMNGDKLESFYSCPYCGQEGFLEDMEHSPGESEDCKLYLEEIEGV